MLVLLFCVGPNAPFRLALLMKIKREWYFCGECLQLGSWAHVVGATSHVRAEVLSVFSIIIMADISLCLTAQAPHCMM